MALKLLQPGNQPLGQFDGYDGVALSVRGGEVGTITGIAVTGIDLAAADADGSDGYVGVPPNHVRAVVTTVLASGNRPLGLIDDGNSGYGVLFGQVVGGTAGQVTAGAVLGPHTATGSGKLTFWDKPGLYAVTLDAVDTAADGLVPANGSLSVGDPLYASATGVLTPVVGDSFEASLVVARFIEFSTGGSLVTTPVHLTAAANSPTGSAGQQTNFTEAVIHFNPPVA